MYENKLESAYNALILGLNDGNMAAGDKGIPR